MSLLLLEKTVSADSVIRFLLEGLNLVSATYVIPAGHHMVSAASETAALVAICMQDLLFLIDRFVSYLMLITINI